VPKIDYRTDMIFFLKYKYKISLKSENSKITVYANENRSQFEANNDWELAKIRFLEYFLIKFVILGLSYA
jgi:hypothetical protein